MELSDLIQPDCIKVPLKSTDKQAAIFELVDLLAEHEYVSDPESVKEAVWQRESTRTTGIGHGLAIPHGKTNGCDRLVMAIGKPAEPIDFQSVDNQPVHIIFLLISPHHQTGAHIQALAQISRLMARDAFRKTVLEAQDTQTIHDLIVQEENVAVESRESQ